MGGRSGSSGVSVAAPAPPAVVAAATIPAPAPTPPPAPAPVFSDTDDADFHQLYNGRQYFLKQNIDTAMQNAINVYLDANPTPGSMYSPSQNANYKLRQGMPLNSTEQNMVNNLDRGMHNLGYNLTLTRYDRVGYLSSMLGLPSTVNPDRITAAQLRSLVGKTYNDPGIVSTSYNNFAKAPPDNCFTDKAVRINIKAPAGAQAFMPGTGPGGDFGEMLLARGQNYRVTGARVLNQRSRSGPNHYNHRVEIDVEMY